MLNQLNVKARTEYLARVRNTPRALMTEQQLADLGVIEIEGRSAVSAPHHGHDDHGHDDHGHDADHGNKGHDSKGHGDHKQKEAAH